MKFFILFIKKAYFYLIQEWKFKIFLYSSFISDSLYILKQVTLSSIIPQIFPFLLFFIIIIITTHLTLENYFHSKKKKMAAWNGTMTKTHIDDEDFNEEQMWGFTEEKDEANSQVKNNKISSKDSSFGSSSSSAWLSSRNIPKKSNSQQSQPFQGSSAPLNIPDWSKIYQKKVKGGSKAEEENVHGNNNVEEDGDDDEDEDSFVPPHEWLARKLARNQISSFSVCEGVGRTLKGRDLSKVRNAVLSKTGFIE